MAAGNSIWSSVRQNLPLQAQPVLVTLCGNPTVYLTQYHPGFGFDCDHVEYWADVPQGMDPNGPYPKGMTQNGLSFGRQ